MQSVIVQDINELISSFDLFINTYENFKQYTAVHSTEEIKNSFKLANFIELIVSSFSTENTLTKLMDVLNKHYKNQGKTFCYNSEFFRTACDHLLKIFFSYQSMDINTIDICVRMYTTLLPKERFQKLLSDLLVKSASYEAIMDFVLENEEPLSKNLEYKLILNDWKRLYEMGRCNEIILCINEMLKFSKVEKSLYIIIGLLALEDVSQDEKSVQTLVLEIISKKMFDRSILSKQFWLTLFNVNKSDLLKICKSSTDFLESICNFVIYIGSMMEFKTINGYNQWMSNPNISICPELSYYDLLSLIKCLTNENFEKKQYVIEKVKQAQINTGSLLWEKLIQDLHL
ncbi:hypothetical protein WA026_009942 [Henosepilachna vigintioctopunctata]|uniref:Uncharacterized protein n=1 Tax=Henosepilachna vigintioctopunctata TaxID=420089 RepID=A0AAW1TRR7_9CUCU